MRNDPDAAAEDPAIFGQPWPLSGWPDVPTVVLTGRDDRLFPVSLQRRVAKQRLGLDITELDGGHLLALSRPSELVAQLVDLAGHDISE